MSDTMILVIAAVGIALWYGSNKKITGENGKNPFLKPLDPQNISTVASTGAETKVIPGNGSVTYLVQPVTVSKGMSPYYYNEATWQRLFAANAFTNPETAILIYSMRDRNNPDYS